MLVGQWKKEILESAGTLFDVKRGPKLTDESSPEYKLYSEIGKRKTSVLLRLHCLRKPSMSSRRLETGVSVIDSTPQTEPGVRLRRANMDMRKSACLLENSTFARSGKAAKLIRQEIA